MDALRLETMSLSPETRPQKDRAQAEKVANQFEAIFVKSLVSSLRQTASVGGEEGGMFGKGPGADTYADWFDNNISEELTRTGGIGIASSLLEDLERNGKIGKRIEDASKQAKRMQRLANGNDLRAATAKNAGGIHGIR